MQSKCTKKMDQSEETLYCTNNVTKIIWTLTNEFISKMSESLQ